MASRSFKAYCTNASLGYRWYIFEEQITLNAMDWFAVVLVKDGRNDYIGGEINSVEPLGSLQLVGRPATVTPSVYTFTDEVTLTDSQYGDTVFTPPFSGYPLTPTRFYDYYSYRYYPSSGGSFSYGTLEADYVFENNAEYIAAMRNGDIQPVTPKVYFDVYINGTDKPSIAVNWTAAEDLSPVLLAPRVWSGVQDLIPLDPAIVEYQGYNVPNAAGAWYVEYEGSQSYGGSYSTTYLTLMQYFEKYLNPVSKVEHWGFDGVPAYIDLYLRMDYDGGATWGELHRVRIATDGTPSDTAIPNSGFGNYETIVRFHAGEPDYILPDDSAEYSSGSNIDGDSDGRYNPNDLPDTEFFDDNEGLGFDGNSVLTTTYSVSASTLQNIGQKLWTQDYFNVLKIQNNPIENIVSVKAFPFDETGGTSEDIKVGDVSFGINGFKISSVKKIEVGAIRYDGSTGSSGGTRSYLDLSPFTIVKIYLPYCGIVQLDASEIFNSLLKVTYIVDRITGDCVAILTLDGIPYMNIAGHMGVDVPLTSSNRVQTELRTAAATINAVSGVAGHIMSDNLGGAAASAASSTLSLMGTDYNSQRTAEPSPTCATFENHGVFLIIEKPLETVSNAVGFTQADSVGYKHLHGYPCNKYVALNQLSGFVAIDRRTDIKIAMTNEENAQLEQLLKEGVYI